MKFNHGRILQGEELTESFDIEKIYTDIILKFKIDYVYPDYRKYLQALEILKNEYRMLNKKKIIIVGDTQAQINWYIDTICTKDAKGYAYRKNMDIEMDGAEEIWVVSYNYRQEILQELPPRAKITLIYDIFAKNELFFERNFYDFLGETYYEFRSAEKTKEWESCDLSHIFFNERIKFEKEKNAKRKKLRIDKLIFLCAYTKDFVLLKKYLSIYEELFGKSKRIVDFEKAIEQLLLEIRKILGNTKKNDIVMVWLDALEYGEDEDMPFLKSLDEESAVFSNAYTVTPYTSHTFKTLFTKKRGVEEDAYKIEQINKANSSFLQMLDERNIEFTYFGVLRLMEKENRAQVHYTEYSVFPMMYWDCIRELVAKASCSESSFCVVHEQLHTHIPYISMGIEGNEYSFQEAWHGRQENVILQKKQVHESRIYVDNILKFWSQILPPNFFKIYMSDHGHTTMGKYHSIMKIQQKDLKPTVISNLFSYYDFDCMVENLLDGKELLFSIDSKEYVWIQDVPYYYKDYILSYIKDANYTNDGLMGYQGIVTLDDMFIRYNDGVEIYQKRVNDNVMVTDERLAWLRNHMSKKSVDILHEEKFKYSRIIVNAEKKYYARSGDIENKKREIIFNIFSNIEATACFAIRGGGMHTLRLLMMLPYELRNKVTYIIDNDADCIAGRLGIKVIKSDECSNEKIDTVFISSYDYKAVWKEEMKQKKIAKIIDLYDEFEKEDIIWTREFYKKKYIPSDFEYSC